MFKPDHPHHAAIHLMKALKCCKDCGDSNENDLLEIRQLEYRKQLLAEQLKAMNYKAESVIKLKDQIRQLELLIVDLKNENSQAQKIGLQQISRMHTDRQIFQNEQRQGLLAELNAQKFLTYELTLQLQSLLERIRYLNRVNNELVYNFCSL